MLNIFGPEMMIFTVLMLTATTGLLLVTTVLWWRWSTRSEARFRLPSGSFGLPILGENLQFLVAFNGNKIGDFIEERATKYGLPCKTHIMGKPTVLMDAPAGNKFLFANEGKLVENSWPKSMNALLGLDSLTFKKGEDYKIGRRHLAAFLTPEALTRYLSQVEANSIDHLARFWVENSEIKTFELMQLFTFKLVADLCISMKEGPEMKEWQDVFHVWAVGLYRLPINLPGFEYHRALKARASILTLLEDVIARRRKELSEGRASPTQDILSNLLTQTDETGRFSTDLEIKDNILLLLFAGHDTSSSALTMTIMYIANHVEVYRRLRAEHDAVAASKQEGEPLTVENLRSMKYTWCVVQETMRLQPPVPGAFREAIADLDYNGYTIPKGWKFYWTNQSTHTNAKFFNDAHKFDPSRFERDGPLPYTFLPFGGGPRLCPGNEFAKMEMLVFLHYVVRGYSWSVVDPQEAVIRNPMPQTKKGTPIKVTKIRR